MKYKTILTGLILTSIGLIAAGASLFGISVLKQNHNALHSDKHGGMLQSVGSYHVEMAQQEEGVVSVYFLGEAIQSPAPVPFEGLELEVRATSDVSYQTVVLKPTPLPNEPAGLSSRFQGKLPESVVGEPLAARLLLRLNSRNYWVRFSEEGSHPDEATASGSEPTMPAPKPESVQNDLFLKPGGLYSQADIDRNGGTPTEVYKGFRSVHNRNPKKGDLLCPITSTVANKKLTWFVDGKAYFFCCPPCIEEFVSQAKEKPKSIQEPDFFVKR